MDYGYCYTNFDCGLRKEEIATTTLRDKRTIAVVIEAEV